MEKKKSYQIIGGLQNLTKYCMLLALVLCIATAFFFTDTANAASSEVVLKAITYAPPGKVEDSMVVFSMFIDRVNKAAQGKLKIEHIGGPEVVPLRNQMDAVSKGIADIVMTFNIHASRVPEIQTSGLSMITPWEERKVGYFELLDKAHKKIGIKLLGRVSTESGFYIFSKNKIEKIDDFKGIKIRSHSGYDPFFKSMGAVTIHMKISEIYTGLDRGLVEAAPYPLFVYDMGVHEVTNYVLDVAFWSSHTTMTFMNLKKFQGLSEEMQNLLLKTAEQLERDMVPVIEDLKAKEKERLKSGGMEFIKLSSDESKKFRRMAIEERMKAIEKQGRVSPETIEEIKVMIWR